MSTVTNGTNYEGVPFPTEPNVDKKSRSSLEPITKNISPAENSPISLKSKEIEISPKKGIVALVVTKVKLIFFSVMTFLGSTEFQYKLGKLHLEDMDDIEKGVYLLKKAAEKEHFWAQFKLAETLYFLGLDEYHANPGQGGCPPRWIYAMEWLEKVRIGCLTAIKFPKGKRVCGLKPNEDVNEPICETLFMLARIFGSYHENSNHKEGLRFLIMAAQRNHSEAKAFLDEIKKGADTDCEYLFMMGEFLYKEGQDEIERNPLEAYELFKKAAQKGHANAEVMVKRIEQERLSGKF